MSSAVQNAARYDKLRKRLWKPFAAAATFAMVASTFAGLSTQMASAITPTNQAGTYGIWAPYYASSYSDKGTNYRATGIDFGGYEHSRLWVAGFGSDNTGNGATNTEDITLDDDANSLVVGVWGGYFETSDTSDNYADITSARPIAAWGWWNTRDTADGYASGTTTIPLFGNNLNRTDSPNGHADARKQGGTLAVDGGLYSGQAGYVGNGPAAYFTSVDDGGGSDKNPYDRDGNHAPSASVITASGLASSKTGGSNDCVEDTNGRTDKSGAWWFLVTEVRGSVGETGSYTYSSASDRANAFWIPSSNMAAMKGAAPAVGYRCIGTHDLAEQQGWSGAEVYQRTGEIFFINDRGVNLVSYGRGYFGLNTCDDGSNSKNAAGISCDKNKLRIMAYNPSNGDWRLSGPMLPEEAADSIFHQGEDPENAGDLAFDSRGNIYTLMEGKAPAPGYGMTNGESEWWRAGDVPDGSLHIYLVRFKQGAHNGNWTYHIIQRFEASPSADADTKEAWGTGSTPVSTSGRKNLKNWEAFAFFNGSIYGATVTKPNGDNDVLTRASLGNGFAYPVENPERPGTDTYGRDPSRRGGITNNLNNIRDIASTQVAHVVEGYVWDDVNADGNITADEKALPQRSIDVALYRELGDGTWELQGTRQTDHNGYYEFLTAGNGKYHVRVDHPVINGVNAVQTWASAGDQGPDPLNPGSMITVDNVVTAHCYDSATDTSVEITSSGACEGNIKMPYKEPDSPVNQMADPDPLAIVSGMPDKTPIYSTINIISNDTEPEVDFGITASTTWGDAKNPPFNTTIAQNGARTVQGIAEALYLGDSYGKYTDGVNDTNAAAHTTDDGITWLPALQNGQALQNATLVAGKMYNVSAKVQGYITDATVKGWLSGPGATSMADATADFSATRSGTSATGTLTMPSYSGSGTVPVQARFVAYPTVENISQPDNTGNQYQSTARTYVSANDSAQPDTNYFTTPGEVEDYQVQMAAAILRLGAQADDTSLVTEDYTYALTNVTPNSDSLRPTTDDTPVWSSSIHTPTGAASPRAVVITSSGNDDTVIDEDNTSCFDTVSGSAVSFTADKDAGTVTVADLADGNDVTCLIAYTAAAEPPTVELDDPTVEGPVTGTVTDENGDPISGAPVTVTDEDDNVLCTATTNASGEFSCQPNRDLEPGEDITATATDPDTGLEGSDTKPVIDQLEVEVDEPLQEGTTGPITGTVTDPDGDPVSGADVTVTDADDNVLCTTTTAADGTFSCNSNRPLEDGETITAKAEDPATGNTGEDDATVGPGLGVEIDEPQYKDAPVSGTVTDPSGDPVEGADVTVKDADDNVLCTATTAADGTWSCQPSRELEPGEEITAEAEDPDTGLTGEDDATVEDPLGVTIDDPKAGDEVITGTVTDENGDPVSGAEVTITDEDDNVLCTATTAADGSYECNSSRPLEEDETITAKAEDPVTGNTGEDDATVGPPADLTVEIDEPQYKDAPVTGTVTDENGDPVDGADVEVKDADDNVLCTTTTASDGTFSCQPSRPLEPGETITAEATDPDTGATGEDDATVADPLEVTVDEPLAAGDTEVSGTVTDPDGNPVANADVTVTDEDDNVLCTTTTDATGAFTCTTSRPLEEGETVTASAEDPATGNTGEDDATVGEDPCVAAGNCVNVEVDEPLTKDGPVTGTVTDENGDPLADAPVTVTDSDGNELCSTTTASDGTFSCQPSRDLEPGETITAEATDPDTGQTGSDDATAPSGPDVALDSPAAGSDPITGTVTDPETGDPISGAPVVVTDDEGNELCSTTTAADGTFSCTPNRPLEDGETITATATDPDTGFEGTDEAEVGEPACAATNTCVNVEVDEPLTKDGPVTGTVTDENGDPIADAPVVVTDSEGNELCSTTTAADGTFSCQPNRPLEPGETITATATDPDNGQTGSDDATAPSGPTVEMDDPTKDGPVTGTVTDPETGDPVEGADVVVTDDEGNELCTATTAADGTFSCQPSRPLEPGEEVTATATDPDTGFEGSDTKPVSDPLEVTVDEPLAAGDTEVTGTVKDPDGNPVSGADVVVTDDEGNELCSTTTAADGTFSCTTNRPLEDGETITAEATDPVTGNTGEDDATVGADPCVAAGNCVNVEVDEPLTKDGPVTGTVTDENGDPLADAPVVVTDSDGNELCSTTTAADGTFSCQPNRPLEPEETITATATDPDTGQEGSDDATTPGGPDVTLDSPTAGSDPITGTVTDPETGDPVEGADVVVTDDEGNELCSTTTAADGTFSCTPNRPLEDGETITATATDPETGFEGSDDATVGEPECAATNTCVNVEIDEPLTKDGPVTGTVTDENGDPIADAPVTVTDSEGNELCSTTTAADGTFSCQPNRPLEPGETITATATDPDNGQTGSDDATTSTGPTVDMDDPTKDGPVTGTVTDPETGDPVEGADVVVTDDEGNELCTATTDADGKFSCQPNRPLEPGEEVTATATDPNTGFEGSDTGEVLPPLEVEVDEPLESGTTGPVTGTVSDPDGNPVSGADVVVTDSEGNELCSTTTAADGTFSCDTNRPLEPGETITAEATDPATGNTGDDDATVPGDVNVDVDEPITKDGPITGTVTDENGDPIADAPVTVTDSEGNELCSTTTAADGTFSCQPNRPLEPGEDLTVTATDPETGQTGSEDVTTPEGPTVAMDDPTKDGPVTGTVTDENGDPIADAPVVVTDSEGNELCETTTGADGKFSCQPNRPLEPGEEITATATDPETGFTGEDTKPVDQPLTVEVDEPLAAGDTEVSGSVSDPETGDPISGADVVVTDEEGNELCSTTTAADGTFSCTTNRPLEDGETITAEATDPVTGNTGEDDATVGADPCEATNTCVNVDVDQPIQKDEPITGTVTDENGDPIADAPVTVTDSEGNELCSTTTAADGTFSCEPNRPLEPGEDLTVTATDPETGQTGSEDVTVPEAPTVVLDDPKVDEPVTGTVTDENGDPIADAPVTVTDSEGNELCTATTGADGKFSCEPNRPLEPGEEITATATDPETGFTGEDTKPVAPADEVNVDVDPVTPDDPVTGTVTDENGDPIEGADVVVTDDEGNVLCTATTDAEGKFTCEPNRPLECGEEITVTATDPDTGATGSKTETVVCDEPGDLDVALDDPVAGDDPITGTVTDPETGDPVSGADVVVTDEEGNELCSTTTAADGTFSCEPNRPLEEGEEITATATDPETGATGEDTATVGPDPCIAADNCVNLDTDPVTPNNPITGTVTDEDGNPIADAPVTVTDSEGNELCSTTTAADGTFSCEPNRPLECGEELTITATDPETGTTDSKTEVVNCDDVIVDADDDTPVDGPATGSVTDPDGNPIPDAPVVITDSEGNVLCETTTDADGNYECVPEEPFPCEELTVTATDPETGATGTDTFTPKCCDTDGTPGITLTVDPTAAVPADGSAYHTVTATVLDAGKCPVQGADVTWDPSDKLIELPGILTTAATDANGQTKIRYASNDANEDPGWPVGATAEKPNGATVTATPVNLKYSEVVGDLIVTPDDDTPVDGPATGTVTDEDGNPIPDAPVVITDGDGNVLCETTTDADGHYECTPDEPFPCEELTVTATDPETGATGSETFTPKCCDDSELTPGITLTVDPTGAVKADGVEYHTVTATVADSAKCPVPGATVTWDPSDKLDVKSGTTPETTTDAEGKARVQYTSTDVNEDPGWPVGASAVKPNGQTVTATPVNLKYADPNAPIVNVTPDDDTPVDGPATGTVTDGDGNPIPDAPVVITDGDGNVLCETTTDADGHYECTPDEPFPCEELTVTATDPETGATGSETFTPKCCDDSELTPGITLTVDPTDAVKADGVEYHTVTATVADSAKCPVPGATVTWSPDGKLQVKSGTTPETTTNAQGQAKAQYTSEYVNTDPGWPVNASAVKPNGQTVTATPVNLKYKDAENLVVTVDDPPPAGPITGNATNPDGTPVVNGPVEITDGDGNPVACQEGEVKTDAQGNFTCTPTEPLTPGDTVTATVTDPDTGNTGSDDGLVKCVDDGKPQRYIEQTPAEAVLADGNEIHTVTVTVHDAYDCPVAGVAIEWVPDSHLAVKTGTTADTVTDAQGKADVQYTSTTANPDPGWDVTAKVSGTELTSAQGAPVKLKYRWAGDIVVQIDEPVKPGSAPVHGKAQNPDGTPITAGDLVLKDADGNTLCTGTVSNGTWSCTPNRPLVGDEVITAEVTTPDGKHGEDDAKVEGTEVCPDGKPAVYIEQTPDVVKADGVEFHTVTVHVRDSITCDVQPIPSDVTWQPDSHLTVAAGTTPDAKTVNGVATVKYTSTTVNVTQGWPVGATVNGTALDATNKAPVYLKYSDAHNLVVVVEDPQPGGPIEGNAKNPDGTPVVNGPVDVTDDAGNPITCQEGEVKTDAQGNFTCTPTTPLQPGDKVNVTVTDPVTGNTGSDDATVGNISCTGTPLTVYTLKNVPVEVPVASHVATAGNVTCTPASANYTPTAPFTLESYTTPNIGGTVAPITSGGAGFAVLPPGTTRIQHTPATDYVGPETYTVTVKDANGQAIDIPVTVITSDSDTDDCEDDDSCGGDGDDGGDADTGGDLIQAGTPWAAGSIFLIGLAVSALAVATRRRRQTN